MQIEIPIELSNIIQRQGKSLEFAIIEALELYLRHDRSQNINSLEPETDWSTKWKQWFAECEAVIDTIQPQEKEYKALLMDKYGEQGLEL